MTEPLRKPFQRVGASSNAQAGKDFERAVRSYFGSRGLDLSPNFPALVGHVARKRHHFDLGSDDPSVVVECKSYTWTAGGNSPSAKIRGLNEAMLIFSVTPGKYRKILVMLRHLRGEISLAAHYIKNNAHLIPAGVEIWEFDDVKLRADQLL